MIAPVGTPVTVPEGEGIVFRGCRLTDRNEDKVKVPGTVVLVNRFIYVYADDDPQLKVVEEGQWYHL
jgi:hypothetical protein